MLEEERQETVDRLEETIPDLIISSESEPWTLELHITMEQVITFQWTFVFNTTHLQLENKISLSCDEEGKFIVNVFCMVIE